MKKFITISLVLIMVATLVGCGGSTYEDGTYEGTAEGYIGPITVEVQVTDGDIADVKVIEHTESPGIADPAIEQVPAAIMEKGSTDVDAIGGATGTSDGIKAAVDNSLE